jgi:hypothetical protein
VVADFIEDHSYFHSYLPSLPFISDGSSPMGGGVGSFPLLGPHLSIEQSVVLRLGQDSWSGRANLRVGYKKESRLTEEPRTSEMAARVSDLLTPELWSVLLTQTSAGGGFYHEWCSVGIKLLNKNGKQAILINKARELTKCWRWSKKAAFLQEDSRTQARGQ